MDNGQHNKIVSFIWGIADDVLRDVYVRGKYRDVILPMTVIRRLDALLESTKKAVLEMNARLDKSRITNKDAALRQAAGQAFYNISPFTLRDLRSRKNQQQLKIDFEEYLNGFSQNVQDILLKFKFRNQIPTMVDADCLGHLIEKFMDPTINLSPVPVHDSNGAARLPGLDNHSMGTIFEELIRRFNEENNEEAGEHFTPRDVVKLMAKLIFLPIADKISSGTYLVYDPACGTGGMLSVAEESLRQIAAEHKKEVAIHLFGQEVNPETYAITKADLLIKGEGEEVDNFKHGSTLSQDGFTAREFDFMLSNPPYGKSWKVDLERMGGKKEMKDPRFLIEHDGDAEYSLITRSSDGQMLFLANMLSKMKQDTPLGSRIAEVHNGSSLFTGDAGQGESNIRQWIMENDWLEAIVALPLNMFYNTGIATYIWVLSNRKPEHRKGKVQLIDATKWFKPLRKNLGDKNCELGEDDIKRICDTYLSFKETEESKIFPNKAFGYWKVTVDRPLRLHSQLKADLIQSLRFASGDEEIRKKLYDEFGEALFENFSSIKKKLEEVLKSWGDEKSDDESEEDETPKKGLSEKKQKKLLSSATWERDGKLVDVANKLRKTIGGDLFEDHNDFKNKVDEALYNIRPSISDAEKKLILRAVSWSVEAAPPVIAKIHKPGKVKADPLHGFFDAVIDKKPCIVEYEPDSELRDSEQIPLLEKGGIEAFIRREVLPYNADAWIDEDGAKIGYEISFTKYFYRPQPLRSLEEIRADIQKIEKESEGLLDELLKGSAK